MPRALTEEERCAQCQKLLNKGKTVVLLYGIRKVSIDDIAKAAGMAKGTFYQHFSSKEAYLFALIEKIHHEAFEQAKQAIFRENAGDSPLRERVRDFLNKLFMLPEMAFFIRDEAEISALLEAAPGGDSEGFKQIEERLFTDILRFAGLDTAKVKPGIVHNYVHAMFLARSSDLMVKDDLAETIDLMMGSLVAYLFGGE